MDSILTARTRLRPMVEADADFIVALLTDADFLANVGDRGVRTREDAEAYIRSGPQASYATHGFGLWCVELLQTGEAIGICGLLQRPTLPAPDVGFALLPAFRGQGYAREAAAATLAWARETKGIPQVLAIVRPENAASRSVLAAVGMVPSHEMQVVPGAPAVLLYAIHIYK